MTARVMLLSTMKQEEPEDEKKKVAQPHLSKRIKFLVAKKANGTCRPFLAVLDFVKCLRCPTFSCPTISGGLMSIGGPWSESKDGGNPANDKTLIKTATYVSYRSPDPVSRAATAAPTITSHLMDKSSYRPLCITWTVFLSRLRCDVRSIEQFCFSAIAVLVCGWRLLTGTSAFCAPCLCFFSLYVLRCVFIPSL